MSIQTLAIGGDHGTDFDIQAVHSIGFRASDMIEAILLNGTKHGDTQGKETLVLEFQQDEYIVKLVVYEIETRGETRIAGVALETNRERTLKAGTLKGRSTVLEGGPYPRAWRERGASAVQAARALYRRLSGIQPDRTGRPCCDRRDCPRPDL